MTTFDARTKTEQPLRRIALKEQAAERIRTLILNGALPGGAVLSETSLAEVLGISRTPVREAFVQLAAEGLVDYSAFNGARVHAITEAEREEVFLLRRTLEMLAVQRLARSATVNQVEILQRILDRQAELADDDDRLAFLDLDAQFHAKLAEFAGLAVTQRFLSHIRSMFYVMGLSATAIEGRSRDVLSEHERILSAIQSGNASEAARAMTTHLSMTQDLIEHSPGVSEHQAPSTA